MLIIADTDLIRQMPSDWVLVAFCLAMPQSLLITTTGQLGRFKENMWKEYRFCVVPALHILMIVHTYQHESVTEPYEIILCFRVYIYKYLHAYDNMFSCVPSLDTSSWLLGGCGCLSNVAASQRPYFRLTCPSPRSIVLWVLAASSGVSGTPRLALSCWLLGWSACPRKAIWVY